MLTLDCSNYGGELTPKIVADWKVAGVEKVVVGIDLAHIALARRQLAVANAGGMRLGAYRQTYWNTDAQASMSLAQAALEGFNIEDVGIAFEDNVPVGYSAQALVRAWVQHNLDVASRVWGRERVILYTAAWWWPNTGSTTQFKDWPLWVADYNGIPDAMFRPFGGWTRCFRHQFRGTTDFCHYSVDCNWEDDMADPEARKAIAILKQQESLKGAVSDNDMIGLVARLQFFGVLPHDIEVKKQHLDGEMAS